MICTRQERARLGELDADLLELIERGLIAPESTDDQSVVRFAVSRAVSAGHAQALPEDNK